jgi:hypothetical protein
MSIPLFAVLTSKFYSPMSLARSTALNCENLMERIADITFIIGPPAPDELKRKFEEWSTNSGKPTSEIWIEYVHDVLGNIVKCNPGHTTRKFDDLVSMLLNTSVQVRDPFLTYMFHDGGKFPGIVFPGIVLYIDKIASPNGQQPQVDWTDARIRDSIASELGLIFKAEWVRTFAFTVERADSDAEASGKESAGDNTTPLATDSPPLSADGLDVGLQALNQVFEQMKIDAEWSVRAPREFVWWMKDFAQHVIVSKPTLSRGIWIARLLSKTTVATDVPLSEGTYERLSIVNAYGTLSALVLEDEGTLSLVTSAMVHQDTLWFVPDLFAFATVMQAADAQIKARTAYAFIGGRVATSSHPTSGVRDQMDDLGDLISGNVAPRGQESSWYAGAEMEDALLLLRKISLWATGSSSGVAAEFPFGESTSLLQMGHKTPTSRVGSAGDPPSAVRSLR